MQVLPLEDTYGRVAKDLRVSLTDRCNLRCSYCMPAEGLDWLPGDEVLTDDEVVRLVRVGVERLGINEVRFTGGEPLVRRGLVEIVRQVREISPDLELSITTNALGLAKTAGALATAGLNRVNVSLDSVRADTFHEITRRDRLDDVVAGLAAAEAAGLGPVKVNAVLLRGVNDDQASELLRWCLDRGYELRFIEQMPLGRPARLDPRRDDHRRRDLRPPPAGLRAVPGGGATRERAGRAVPGRRRPGHGGRDRLGDPTVLW